MSNIIEVSTEEEIKNLARESNDYPTLARDIAAAIKDEATMENAAEFLKTIKGFQQKAKEKVAPLVSKARAAYDEAKKIENEMIDPLKQAEAVIKNAMGKYRLDEQTRLREEEERVRAEQRRRNEESQLASAAAAESVGDVVRAEAIISAPPAPVFNPAPAPKKISGISFREKWKCEVFDLAALVKAVAAGQAPLAALQPNDRVLSAQANSLKAEMKYPGVRVFSVQEVASRAQ